MTAAHGKAKRALAPTEKLIPVAGDPDWHEVTRSVAIQVSSGLLYETLICACGLRHVTVFRAIKGFHKK